MHTVAKLLVMTVFNIALLVYMPQSSVKNVMTCGISILALWSLVSFSSGLLQIYFYFSFDAIRR